MFERTLEAQALDAPGAKLSPFSLALLVHAAVILAFTLASLVFIPPAIGPEPREIDGLVISFPPIEYELEAPASGPPAPPKGGNPPPAPVEPTEPRPPDAPPTLTPDDLPEPPPAAPADGTGSGETGVLDGAPDGVPDGVRDGVGDGAAGPGNGEGSGSDPVELTAEMVPPRLVHKVAPDYPLAARIGRIPGRVVIEAVIGLDGSVESVVVLSSSSPLFDDAARSAVAKWRYRPATMGGRPVRVYFKVEVGFVLR